MNTLVLKGTSTFIFTVWVPWQADSEMEISTEVYKGVLLVRHLGKGSRFGQREKLSCNESQRKESQLSLGVVPKME